MDMKIPFDIKYRPQIESGEYRVETKVGCPVRIVCWDMACELPILGLVLLNDEKAEEIAVGFTNEGTNLLGEPLYDKLFIITPGPELTEFEKGCIRLYQEGRDDGLAGDNLSDEILKESAAELLELARKELEPEVLERLDAAYKNQDEVVYENGKRDGKAEALKDLPRWKKCADCTPKPKYSNEWIFSIDTENVTRESAIVHKGYFLPLDGLERLPGFNE